MIHGQTVGAGDPGAFKRLDLTKQDAADIG
jgi:hypothetical protein